MQIKQNGLTFTTSNFGYICQDLITIPQRFAEKFSKEEARAIISEFVSFVRGKVKQRFATKEETESHSELELIELGQKTFDTVLNELQENASEKSLFEEVLFWLGDWWYYHPVFLRSLIQDRTAIWDKQHELAEKIILPVLPEPVRRATEGMVLAGLTVNFGHFAVLFCDKNGTRRIVTDTQLYELHGVGGYSYIDLDVDGKPIARSRSDRGGGRAFFDGTRLMSHRQFETCAPKTILIEGGYKVNSTRCTIVSGQLFDLIDVDDAVAKTTGAFMGWCDFTSSQLADSTDLAQNSAKQMKVADGKVYLNGEEIHPFGVFMPSAIRLLENGFTLYDWSEFHEIETIRYQSVLVVDDNQQWIDSVVAEFGSEVKELKTFQTHSGSDAISKIIEVNPGAVVLDIHLTPEERFDGLWVANELAKQGFKGKVMIASSYGDEHLRAMQRLIKIPTVATGKNLDRIRKVLTGKDI